MSNNKSYNTTDGDTSFAVCDAAVPYQSSLFELDECLRLSDNRVVPDNNVPTGLQPIVKWPGGKEKELKYIMPNLPVFKRFFEPFVGGGSVYMSVRACEYLINDLSSELVALYQGIATADREFFRYSEMLDASWVKAHDFFSANKILVEKYLQYRGDMTTREELRAFLHGYCQERETEILQIIGPEFASCPCILPMEMEKNLFRKMTRMRELEMERHVLPYGDVLDNIETAIKSAVYMNYRHVYNDRDIARDNAPLHTALFLFMRNYAYSGMFRYSGKGEFNVPYGGIAYNAKLMARKLNYYRSRPVSNHFAATRIYNLDFEAFLRETKPSEDDFVFLDPPYDSEFSTYAQNTFTRADQARLANYMICECKAKWMMIIKNTDFIYGLYDKEGIRIRSFDKEYIVSFMNRNDKKVTHLMITNY